MYPKYPNFPGTHPDSPWGYPQTHPDVLQRFRSDPKSRFLMTKRVNVVCTEACPIVCTRTFLTVGPGMHPWTLHLSLTHQPIPARDRIIQHWTTCCARFFSEGVRVRFFFFWTLFSANPTKRDKIIWDWHTLIVLATFFSEGVRAGYFFLEHYPMWI